MNRRWLSLLALVSLSGLAGCNSGADSNRAPTAKDFPQADRSVSSPGGIEFGAEDQRDNLNEAGVVMDLAAIGQGTTVADIGAGAGYYTVRLSERVGARGRVLAQDIDPAAIQRLGQRVQRERLDNVSIKTGVPDDPKLPENSFDRIFMVHMYHEVSEPYAFLWHMRPALRPGGRVIVVDVDRPTDQHGIPPALLFCEFNAVGFRLVEFVRKPELRGYFASFEVSGPRPVPQEIRPCGTAKSKTGTQ